MKTKYKKAIFWAAIALLGVTLFLSAQSFAIRYERGYKALGGEYLLLLLPLWVKITKDTICKPITHERKESLSNGNEITETSIE